MGKYVLLGLIALTAAVFMMGSCEGLVDVVKDLDNIDDDDNNDDGDSVTLPSEYDGYTQITSVAAYNKLAEKTNYVILIRNITDFQKIGKEGGYPLDGVYVQTENITITSDNNWTPIGTIDSSTDNDFSGAFDGNNHNIIINDNLTFDTDFSFFGDTNSATLKNIHIMGTGSITVKNDSIVENWGSVKLGGIASNAANTTFENCSNNAALTAHDVGGICHTLYGNTTITKCWNTGTITSTLYGAGGIAGIISEGNKDNVIKNCYNTGAIIGSGTFSGSFMVGGICGMMDSEGAIIACYNKGAVSVKQTSVNKAYVGGIVGEFQGNTSEIIACYNKGKVRIISTSESNECKVGGIAGYVSRTGSNITACYNIGEVHAQEGFAGGIAGAYGESSNRGIIISCYWKAIDNIAALGTSTGTAASNNNSKITVTTFSSTAWPSTVINGGNAAWGIGDSGSENAYWKSLGSWNNDSPIYPVLWWE
jgi:hypothetical protein